MSYFSQCHSIIIDLGISVHGHVQEVVDGLNAMDKGYMYKLMSNVKLPVSRTFDSQIIMHSCTPKNYVSLAKEFQINLVAVLFVSDQVMKIMDYSLCCKNVVFKIKQINRFNIYEKINDRSYSLYHHYTISPYTISPLHHW